MWGCGRKNPALRTPESLTVKSPGGIPKAPKGLYNSDSGSVKASSAFLLSARPSSTGPPV